MVYNNTNSIRWLWVGIVQRAVSIYLWNLYWAPSRFRGTQCSLLLNVHCS